jgi:hypothetical protein
MVTDSIVDFDNASASAALWMELSAVQNLPSRYIKLGGRRSLDFRLDVGKPPLHPLVPIAGLGHAWSGERQAGILDPSGLDALRIALRFFNASSMAR